MDRVSQIESILKVLISTQPGDSLTASKEYGIIENSLKDNLEECQRLLQSDTMYSWIQEYHTSVVEGDYYWEYVKMCLKILKCLKEHLSAESKHLETSSKSSCSHAGILNIKQQNYVQKMCEFIICLGVGRNLLPEIGIPWESRSRLTGLIPKNGSDYFQMQLQLHTTLETLLEISELHVIGNLLLSKHLQDILAGLCQLNYWPIKNGTNDAEVFSRERNQIRIIKEFSRQSLQNVIERAYQPKVIRELLFLQGYSKQKDLTTEKCRPTFIHKCVSQLLMERLLKKQGVKSFALALLDSGDNEEKVEQRDWVKCDIIVRLISSFTTSREHCITIFPQIVALLYDETEDEEKRHQFMKIAKLVTMNVSPIHKELADELIFRPQFKDLLACTAKYANQGPLPTEEQLELCITRLHKIFSFNDSATQTFVKYLSPVVAILFRIFSFLNGSISHLRTLTEQLISSYLKNIEKADFLIAYQMLFIFEENASGILPWNPNLKLNHGSAGAVVITEQVNFVMEELGWLGIDDANTSAFCKLMLIINDDDMASHLFLYLLQDLSSVFDVEEHAVQNTETHSQLLQLENNQRKKETSLRRSLITLNVLSNLCKNFSLEDAIMKDKSMTITLIKKILAKGSKLCQSNEIEFMNSETLQMAMSVLTLVINEQEFATLKDEAKIIISSLEILSAKHSDDNVRMLADELRKYISTMGAIPVTIQPFSKSPVENVSQSQAPKATKTYMGDQKGSQNNDASNSDYQQTKQDLQDGDIPTRGHALLTCTKLIQSKNKELSEDKESLLALLLINLEHNDSYVYLLATQAVACLAVEYPDFVLPTLLIKYGDESNPELQMKIGEVILKLVSLLNDVVVRYRDLLINSFINSTKNSDPLIRASSLSNLGQLCKGLKFSLGSNVHEIFLHLSSFAKCDSSSQVRSAAVQVITLLLRGLGKDAIKVLETVLKEMYRLLKHVYQVDKDDIVKLHVQLALQELDIICRDFLFPTQVLEKKIRILN